MIIRTAQTDSSTAMPQNSGSDKGPSLEEIKALESNVQREENRSWWANRTTLVLLGVYGLLSLRIAFGTLWINRSSDRLRAVDNLLAGVRMARIETEGETEAKRIETEGKERVALVEATAAKAKQELENKNLQLRAVIENATAEARTKQAELAKEQAKLQVEQRKTAEAQRQTAEAQLALKRHLEEVAARQADRHLTPEQRANLIALLTANPKGEISVICVGGTPEPCTFAAELVDVCTKSGWTVKDFSQGVVFVGGSPAGLILRVHSAEKAPARASILQKAFERVGVIALGEVLPDLAEDTVSLVVGSKPTQ